MAGRDTVMTEEKILELIACFHDGLNVQQACWQVEIHRDTYYHHYNTDPAFSDRMDRARQFLSMNSRRKIKEAIMNGDLKTARWYLERRDKDDFSSRTEVTGRNGKPLNPVTLDPKEKERLDNIMLRKNGKPDTTGESATGDSQSNDSPGGGTEGQSVS